MNINRTIVRNIALNFIGALVYALAINSFLIPSKLGEGGVTGLMTIFYYWIGFPPALTNLILNGILLFVGWKMLSKQTVLYTIVAIASISFWLKLTSQIQFKLHDPLVAAIIGGVLMGIAMGIIMKGEGTTAGSTILAKIMNKYFGIKTGSAMLSFDLLVAVPSFVLIGFENMLLTIIELYISAVVLNKMLEAFIAKRAFTIISDKSETIAQALSNLNQTGITLLDGHGYVSGQPKKIIYCVCEAKLQVKVMDKIAQIDPTAFVVLDEVRSAYGNNLIKLL